MSKQELERLSVIEQVEAKHISQKQGAKQLGISPRQLRRLQKSYKNQGASGLISGKRGKPSNHKYSEAHKNKVLAAIEKNYRGFGPKLVSECLQERQDIKISIETARQWMIEDGLWATKGKKCSSAHQQRERRSFFGELIQIDGSYHDWFEGRSEKCCLLVAIDDATSSILWLRFCKAETTQDYFAFMEQYFSIYGLPQSFYTDKHGVFRVNHPGTEETNLTQFSRALKELGVVLIHASTPQAKGRVERANKTLQDRLIKLMRLENISSIEQANAYLPEFIEKHNAKFAITPSKLGNAHCAIDDIYPMEIKMHGFSFDIFI